MINLSIKIGDRDFEVGQIGGHDVNFSDPQHAELIAMMVIDWAEDVRAGNTPREVSRG